MPRQHHQRATAAQCMRRASSAERHPRVNAELLTTTTTADLEEQGRLRRVRSFTTRSGTVINRGDSFKVRGAAGGHGDGDVEPTRRRRHAPRDVVAGAAAVDSEYRRRSHSAAASTSRHHRAPDLLDVTNSVVVDRYDVTSADTSYTVMVLGDHGVGKTTVTQQLLTSEYLANKDYNAG